MPRHIITIEAPRKKLQEYVSKTIEDCALFQHYPLDDDVMIVRLSRGGEQFGPDEFIVMGAEENRDPFNMLAEWTVLIKRQSSEEKISFSIIIFSIDNLHAYAEDMEKIEDPRIKEAIKVYIIKRNAGLIRECVV